MVKHISDSNISFGMMVIAVAIFMWIGVKVFSIDYLLTAIAGGLLAKSLW